MPFQASSLSYAATNSFAALVNDYLVQDAQLNGFYQHAVSQQGLSNAIAAKQQHPTNRKALVQALEEQYQQVASLPAVQQNIALLGQDNCFTICTAHQPNIFTGHLYFIYKILHAISLAQWAGQQFPDQHFVPVFYMGSEDADLDELGHINIDGEKISWDTQQTGAVGRMHTKGLEKIVQRLQGQFAHLPHGQAIVELFGNAYRQQPNIQTATLQIVHELFGRFGLVVLVPDNAQLKALFKPVLQKELTTQFSQPLVAATAEALGKHYKVQASGRAINLFYLADGIRNRIEQKEGQYLVVDTTIEWSPAEMMQELDAHPERFSPNVILRGLFQETILPNVAFIGGGGEIAYWMELKKVFDACGVPYPLLVLRNSFLWMNAAAQTLQAKLNIDDAQLFQSNFEIANLITRAQSANELSIEVAKKNMHSQYQAIQQQASSIDASLDKHVAALQKQALHRLNELSKKMMRAEKRKHEAVLRQAEKLKKQLFPNSNLQERVDNLVPYYAQYGPQWLDVLLQYSLALDAKFVLIKEVP
jgi:bacillithiol synthase